MQTVPPLCDFEQWIDTEIKESDKQHLEGLKEWDAEVKERFEQRHRQEAIEKEHKEEEERRRVGRRGRRSLSVCVERRQRWRRIPMPRGRESGLVALSRYLVYS